MATPPVPSDMSSLGVLSDAQHAATVLPPVSLMPYGRAGQDIPTVLGSEYPTALGGPNDSASLVAEAVNQ